MKVQFKLRSHGIEDALDFHVIDAAVHQHPSDFSGVPGKALELLQDGREKARDFGRRHGHAVRVADADLGPGVRKRGPFRPQVTREDSGGFVPVRQDRKSTRLNSSHSQISYAVFCLKKKKTKTTVGRAAKKQNNK